MRKDKPNWDEWNFFDNAAVWKVAALSLDIDPDTVEIDMGDWVTRADGKNLKKRIEIIGENYEKIDSSANTLSMNGRAYWELNIPKFAKWAIEKNLPIPDELKQRAKSVQLDDKEKPLFDEEDTKYPIELDIALRAWKAVSTSTGNGKPKARIKAWLDKNTSLSNEAKNRISIVSNWDKSGGATRTK